MEWVPMGELLYSSGTMNPGAITLHNLPRFLQRLPTAAWWTWGATNILCSRESSVLRHYEFRRQDTPIVDTSHRRSAGHPPVCDVEAWAEYV